MYKFNGGKGAVICDQCQTVITENVSPNRDYILCHKCQPVKLTNFCEACLGSGRLVDDCLVCGGIGLVREHD